MALMPRGSADEERWQAAMMLLATWRRAHEELRHDAVAHHLDQIAAAGGPDAVTQAACGLADIAGMFIELYADSTGLPVGTVFDEAAALMDTDDAAD